jgi:hypothetical protein
MLNPPIRNIGVKGIRKAASEITGNQELREVALAIRKCGDLWEQAVAPCVDALEVSHPEELIANRPDPNY